MSILDTAKEEKVDLIVIVRETGFKRFALGSVAQYVSRHSSVPVLVLQSDGSAPLAHPMMQVIPRTRSLRLAEIAQDGRL